MNIPARVPLKAYAGDTWAQTFRFLDDGVPVDLTDATAASWVRSTTGKRIALAVSVGPDPGEVTIGIADEPLLRDVYAYDVQVTKDGAVRTWVRGPLQVLRDVTEEEGSSIAVPPVMEVAA